MKRLETYEKYSYSFYVIRRKTRLDRYYVWSIREHSNGIIAKRYIDEMGKWSNILDLRDQSLESFNKLVVYKTDSLDDALKQLNFYNTTLNYNL